jgi:hypothetical protein
MAAKNKRSSLPRTPASGAHDSVGLHMRAAQHRDDLLEEAKELQAAGKIREARAVERRAAQVEQLVGALETEVRWAEAKPDSPTH